MNLTDADGNSCLHSACEAGMISTVQGMLDCNADVLSKNKYGETPLHKAASCGSDCSDVCLLLLGKEANVNVIDINGNTPLHVALRHGNVKAAGVLLENGADWKLINVYWETVVYSLVKEGVISQEFCEQLISDGASPQDLLFHFPLKNSNFKLFCFLLEQWGGSATDDLQKVNITNVDIGCLLCVAVNECDYDSCKRLLSYGTNVNVVNNKGELAVSFMGHSVLVKGFTALHISVARSDIHICCLLLDHGASVNAQILALETQPLHCAVYLGDISICSLLIERGLI